MKDVSPKTFMVSLVLVVTLVVGVLIYMETRKFNKRQLELEAAKNSINIESSNNSKSSTKDIEVDKKLLKKTYNEKTIDNIKEHDYLYSFLYKYMEYINSKDFTAAYLLLSDEYIEDKDLDFEKFKEEMENKYDQEMTIRLQKYIKKDNYFLCTVEIYAANFGDEETGEFEGKTFIDEYTLIKTEEGLKLMLDKINLEDNL